jgi:hypothetical protein
MNFAGKAETKILMMNYATHPSLSRLLVVLETEPPIIFSENKQRVSLIEDLCSQHGSQAHKYSWEARSLWRVKIAAELK